MSDGEPTFRTPWTFFVIAGLLLFGPPVIYALLYIVGETVEHLTP